MFCNVMYNPYNQDCLYFNFNETEIACFISHIVIVISKLLKRYSKAKRTRAPAYSRALRRIKGGNPKGGQEKLRSEFQSTRRGNRHSHSKSFPHLGKQQIKRIKSGANSINYVHNFIQAKS